MDFIRNACDRIMQLGQIEFTVQDQQILGLPIVTIDENILMTLVEEKQMDATGDDNDQNVDFETKDKSLQPVIDSIGWQIGKPIWTGSFNGLITAATVEDPQHLHLWIQKTSNLDDLTTLQRKLKVVAGERNLTEPEVGQICAVLFDGCWFRAKVRAVCSNKVKLLFIDCGRNEEGILPELQLKALPFIDDLYREALAFECILPSSTGCQFAADAINFVSALGQVDIQLAPDLFAGLPTVNIDRNILSSLELEICSCEQKSSGENPNDVPAVSISKHEIEETVSNFDTNLRPESKLNCLNNWRVKRRQLTGTFSGMVAAAVPIVGDAKHLRLWIHRACDIEDLAALHDLLGVEATYAQDIHDPFIGQTCIAKHKDKWCRVEVQATSLGVHGVFLLDYGIEVLGSTNELHLKMLPFKERLYCDSFAFECILACPGRDVTSNFVDQNRKCLNESNELTVKSDSGINQNPFYMNPAKCSIAHDDLRVNGKQSIRKSSLNGSFAGLVSVAALMKDGKAMRLWVQRICDFDELINLQCQLENLADSTENLTDPKIGQLCIGLFEGGWYRAEIKAVDSTSVRVLFLDYGNEEEGTMEELQLRALPHREELFRDAFALECILNSPEHCCFKTDASEKITEYSELQFSFYSNLSKLPVVQIDADLQSLTTADTEHVTAPDSGSASFVSQQTEEHAKWAVKMNVLSGSFEGVVTTATIIGDNKKRLHLWIQKSSDIDALNALQSQLETVATSAETLTDPKVGQFCIGLFEGGWFRAEVKAVCSQSVRVLYIDYGNEEEGTLDALQLKVLPQLKELYQNFLAFECILTSPNEFASDACNMLTAFTSLNFCVKSDDSSDIPEIKLPTCVMNNLLAVGRHVKRDSPVTFESDQSQTPLSTKQILFGMENFFTEFISTTSRDASLSTSCNLRSSKEQTSNALVASGSLKSCKLTATTTSCSSNQTQQRAKLRLRYTPEQMRNIFATMPPDFCEKILPAPIPPPDLYDVVVLPASDSAHLSVHLLPWSQQLLHRLAARMHLWYDYHGVLIRPVSYLFPGKFVAFFFKASGGICWYRGSVLSVDSGANRTASLLAVDYGFISAKVPCVNLRELPPELTGPDWPAAVCVFRLATGDQSLAPHCGPARIEVLPANSVCRLLPAENDRVME